MKKLGLIVLIIIILVVLGVFFFAKQEQSPQDFSSLIQQAYSGKTSVVCRYTLEEFNAQTTTYIKGDKLRVDTIDQQNQRFSLVYASDRIYFWQEESAQGFIFPKPDESAEQDAVDGVQSIEDIKAEIDQYKASCRQEKIGDSQFNPPANINFQDIGGLFPLSQ